MSNEKTYNRKPGGSADGGIKTGGRFDIKIHSEPAPIKVYEDDNPENGFEGKALLDVTYKIVKEYALRLNLDREETDDVAQEVLLSVLATQSNKVQKQIEAGVPEKEAHWAINGGYIRHAAKAFAGRRVDVHKRHEDSKALKMLREQAETIEAVEGRHLDASELRDLAASIRDNWHDPRHKPAENFYLPPVVVSSDAMGDAFAQSQAGVYDTVIEGSADGHDLADLVENKALSPDDARRQLWNSMRAETYAPAAVEGLLTGAQATRFEGTVGKKPAAVAIVAQHVFDGTATPAQADAFFAPFGALTEQEKLSVSAAIADRGEFGGHMWLSALDLANRDYNAKTANRLPKSTRRATAAAA
jgi:hypothetical protein